MFVGNIVEELHAIKWKNSLLRTANGVSPVKSTPIKGIARMEHSEVDQSTNIANIKVEEEVACVYDHATGEQ